ncbi:MAG: IPTL-CTERM sorting domain-containing protein [Bacteroidota bacterium]
MKIFSSLFIAMLLCVGATSVKADCVAGNLTVLNTTVATVNSNQSTIEGLIENAVLTATGTAVNVTITSVTAIPGGVTATMEIGSTTTTLTPAEAAQINGLLSSPLTPALLTNALQTSGIPGMQAAIVTSVSGQILTGNCPSNAAVPTMSQWGLIVLGLLVMNLGAIAIFRRRKVFAQA